MTPFIHQHNVLESVSRGEKREQGKKKSEEGQPLRELNFLKL